MLCHTTYATSSPPRSRTFSLEIRPSRTFHDALRLSRPLPCFVSMHFLIYYSGFYSSYRPDLATSVRGYVNLHVYKASEQARARAVNQNHSLSSQTVPHIAIIKISGRDRHNRCPAYRARCLRRRRPNSVIAHPPPYRSLSFEKPPHRPFNR